MQKGKLQLKCKLYENENVTKKNLAYGYAVTKKTKIALWKHCVMVMITVERVMERRGKNEWFVREQLRDGRGDNG
jgi:hypothetical protein